MTDKRFAILLSIVVIGLIMECACYCSNNNACTDNNTTIVDTVYVYDTMPLSFDNPQEHLSIALDYFNVRYKDVVMAQAILETGHFTSNVYTNYNNMFGLSHRGRYYSFHKWWESIIAYRFMVQDRYDGPDNSEDYLKWIVDMGYAEDTLYYKKIKSIMK